MILSKNTIDILKVFAAINQNIVIKPGNKLSTVSVAKNVMAEYTAAMKAATDYLTLTDAGAIGKAIGSCYWMIDDAKDVWIDLEAGHWNLFLHAAAEEDAN